ncbi:cell division protein ZapE [Nakamurella sp. YIM 132087]|uniref:Cell division protein ZapE n=1 Tax=Nakamurella alba TaxID=2665158 RepID=A0A7K1FUA2_9ACTN|nr:cell division protein ZapE [Nakamurella alba]MTD16414.1 cell division protein ZapE [Nakamurella alba]
MSVAHLVDVQPVVSPDELIDGLVPPPRFQAARFSTYRPAPTEPSQQAALTELEAFAGRITTPKKTGLFRKTAVPAGAVYLDGGFGVGKTHLLASLWHAVPGPKAYGTFVEYTNLVGALGFAETVRRLSGHRLLAVDEFELDDPGDTMLMTRLLGALSDAGVALCATSNTLPDKLGEGRFAADDFKREIRGLSERFTTLRVDGPDFRHAGLAQAPAPLPEAELLALAESTPGATLDGFAQLTARLSQLHQSTYGRLVLETEAVHIGDVTAIPDQASALRWVVLIDRLYDRTVPVRSSGAPLDELFTPEMLRGGYRKKYLRATSRVLALARDGAAAT